MIVKMSKYAFMVYHKEYDAFLQELRELGVLHVKEINSIKDHDGLQSLLAERKRLDAAVRFSAARNKQSYETVYPAGSVDKEKGLQMAAHLEDLQEKGKVRRTIREREHQLENRHDPHGPSP